MLKNGATCRTGTTNSRSFAPTVPSPSPFSFRKSARTCHPERARGRARAKDLLLGVTAIAALSLAVSSLGCGRSRTASTNVGPDTTVILIVADSAAAVYRAKQVWNDYRSRHALDMYAMRTYAVAGTDTSYVVTLLPENVSTVGGGVVIEVLRSGRARIIRIME